MGLFDGGAKIADTSDLEVGYSKDGMQKLDESLKSMLVDEIKAALDRLNEGVTAALDECWQGVSKDRYLKDFGKRIEDTKEEIEKEYDDLKERFSDVSKYFKDQDDDLYEKVM